MRTTLVMLIASLVVPVRSAAQSTIPWSTVDMGFASSSSSTTMLKSTVGQVLVGTMIGTSSIVETGFFADTLLRGTVVSVGEHQGIPAEFALHQNFPNPFNPGTTIRFALPRSTMVSLKVYDLLGQEILTLVDGEQRPGVYNVRFDASRISSGMYIYRICAGDFIAAKRLLLLK
jgi:hypothetical protein